MGYKSLSGSLSLCQCRAVSGAEEGREKEREREREENSEEFELHSTLGLHCKNHQQRPYFLGGLLKKRKTIKKNIYFLVGTILIPQKWTKNISFTLLFCNFCGRDRTQLNSKNTFSNQLSFLDIIEQSV